MNMAAQNVIILSEVDSSNNYANSLINEGKAHNGTVVLALCQQKGRGQGRNSWQSAPGMNLLASIILFPDFLPPAKQFYLSKITSLAVADYIKEETDDIFIKWPNDIYCGNKKICGILIENIIQGSKLYSSVLGIGMNLNQLKFGQELPNPVSLKNLTGKDYPVEDTMQRLKRKLFFRYHMLEKGQFDEIDNQYHENLFRRGKWSLFKKDDQVFEARIKGVGQFGQLIVEGRSGILSEYMFREIEYVL